MGCLYQLSFPNGKSYIGITTTSLHRRILVHRHHARKGRLGALQNAIRKYGSESFISKELVIANDLEYLLDLERRAIVAFGTKYPGGYNLTGGGEGTCGFSMTDEQRKAHGDIRKGKNLGNQFAKGYRHTDEAKETIAAAGRGKVFSEDRKAKIGASKIGNKFGAGLRSEEAKKNMSAWQKGKPKSEAHKAAMSAAAKSRCAIPETREKMSHRLKGKPWSEKRRQAQKAKHAS